MHAFNPSTWKAEAGESVLSVVLERMWSKGNTPPLLVGVQTCTDTLEINMAVSQKTGNQTTSKPSYTTLGHISKGCTII